MSRICALAPWLARVAACCVLMVWAHTRAEAQGAGALRWGADAEGGAPYIFLDGPNLDRKSGFEVELAAALGAEIGRPIEHVQYPFDNLAEGLNRGDIDLAMNGLEITPDRKERLRLSRPYYVFRLQLVARGDDSRFNSLDDVAQQQLTVGTLANTTASRLLAERGITTLKYDGQREPFEDLKHGKVDAVLLDLPIVAYYANPAKDSAFRYAGEPFVAGLYAIGFKRLPAAANAEPNAAVVGANEALASEIDAAIGRLHASGKLRLIYEKWGLWNDDQKLLENPPAELERFVKGTASAGGALNYLPLLLQGAALTTLIAVCGMGVAVAVGLVVALMRLYGPAPVRWLALAYVEFFRGIPVAMLLYFLYYGLPSLGEHYGFPWLLNLPPVLAAIMGFGLNYAAYEAEIYRAGISAIPRGQWEAADSLGMSRALTFRRIILPQAVRGILPPMTSDFVSLFKDTSVASLITVEELSKRYQIVAKSNGNYVEVFFVAAALYLIMSIPLGYLARYLERRWGRGLA